MTTPKYEKNFHYLPGRISTWKCSDAVHLQTQWTRGWGWEWRWGSQGRSPSTLDPQSQQGKKHQGCSTPATPAPPFWADSTDSGTGAMEQCPRAVTAGETQNPLRLPFPTAQPFTPSSFLFLSKQSPKIHRDSHTLVNTLKSLLSHLCSLQLAIPALDEPRPHAFSAFWELNFIGENKPKPTDRPNAVFIIAILLLLPS